MYTWKVRVAAQVILEYYSSLFFSHFKPCKLIHLNIEPFAVFFYLLHPAPELFTSQQNQPLKSTRGLFLGLNLLYTLLIFFQTGRLYVCKEVSFSSDVYL